MASTAHRIVALTVILVAALVASGCGGSGKDIADVQSCLKKLELDVQKLPADKDVESGVFATSKLPGAAPIVPAADKGDDGAATDEFTFALAAHVKSDKAVDQFQKDSEEFGKASSTDDKLDVRSGSDARYVWVVGGDSSTDSFKDAKDCVEP